MPHLQASRPGKSHRQRHAFPKGEADSKDVDDAVMDLSRGPAELRLSQGKKYSAHTKMPGKSKSQILGKVRQRWAVGQAVQAGGRQVRDLVVTH